MAGHRVNLAGVCLPGKPVKFCLTVSLFDSSIMKDTWTVDLSL